jgi:hypothetical protein
MKESFSSDKAANLREKEDSLGKRGQLLEDKGQVSCSACAISQLRNAL